ncbi:PP2C family protein-serine/threonine phosphatase [Flectobacillus major]|uniref:PP2C family protein-serine/threonine phosphatase n=1 Tax=Flectobacillus major TaxID=103 RepID=UPI0003F71FE3|nr:protein phosphatase 2C domain-containing protein [Flectobacillus major]
MIQNNQFKTVSKSAIGGRRENQDSEGSLMTKLGFLCVVCDGMGGAAGGKTASAMAVNIILQEVANTTILHPGQALLTAINKANHEIFSRGRQQTELRGMGTTVTALILNNDKATIAHAGDSRIYLLRDGEKVFRTNDHSKVFELVKRGILTEEQARLSEESNVIQRALGIAPDIEVEINDNIPFLKNDLFMLCTDGVCGAVSEENLLQMLTKDKDIRALAEKIITQIDTLGNRQGGGHDNLTVSFVQPLVNSKLEVKIDMKTKLIIYALSTVLALFAGLAGYLFFSRNPQTDTSKFETEIATLKTDTTQLRAVLRKFIQELDSLKSKKNNSSHASITSTESISRAGNSLPPSNPTIQKDLPSTDKKKKDVRQTVPNNENADGRDTKLDNNIAPKDSSERQKKKDLSSTQ